MAIWRKSPKPVDTPVLVVDMLGFSRQIKACGVLELAALSATLDHQYHRFRAKVPFGVMLVTGKRVIGSRDFCTFRLNDMFVLFSERQATDAPHRHLVASVLLQQVLLLEGFIPRGGLGTGAVLRTKDTILGAGFIDAYEAGEKRHERFRNICAIQLSQSFMARMPQSKMSHQLLYFFDGMYFINPCSLTDPEMGAFTPQRILDLLTAAGIDSAKLEATTRFFSEAEDFETAARPGSRSWNFVHAHGGPTGPAK